METRLYVIHALAPVHSGTGQGEGLIDLPIARERATDHPLIPGSSVKGVLRDAARQRAAWQPQGDDNGLLIRLFGPERDNASDHAGAARFSDARLVLFPVTSDTGTFAWVTCPWVLTRLLRDAPHLGPVPAPPEIEADAARVAEGSPLVSAGGAVLGGLRVRATAKAGEWPAVLARLASGDPTWQRLIAERVAIVADDTFTWLVRNRTDVRAHIAIDPDTGTVADGALWYEESLPAESVLVGLAQVEPNTRTRLGGAEAMDRLGELLSGPLQFGGNATTGMGLATVRLVGGVG